MIALGVFHVDTPVDHISSNCHAEEGGETRIVTKSEGIIWWEGDLEEAGHEALGAAERARSRWDAALGFILLADGHRACLSHLRTQNKSLNW